MPILDILGAATGFARDIVDRFFPKKMGEAQKAEAALEIQKLIEARDSTLINASKEIIVAELHQGDEFTKRARPMIVYVGLFAVVFNYVFVPFINRIVEWVALIRGAGFDAFSALSPIHLPTEFWYVWGGVCSVYMVGRTAEKRGARHAIVGMITGNKGLHK